MRRKKQQGSALRYQNIFNIKKQYLEKYMYFSMYSKLI